MEWMCIKIKQGNTHRQITMQAHSIDFNYAKLCGIASFFHFTTKNFFGLCVCVCVCIRWCWVNIPQHCWHDNAHIYSIFVNCIKVRTSLSWPIEHLFPSFDLRPVSRNLSIVISKYYALHEGRPNDVANSCIKKCVKFCICCSINFTSLIYSMHAFYPIIRRDVVCIVGGMAGGCVLHLTELHHLTIRYLIHIYIERDLFIQCNTSPQPKGLREMYCNRFESACVQKRGF